MSKTCLKIFFLLLFIPSFSFSEVKVCTDDFYKILDPQIGKTDLEKRLGTGLIYETLFTYSPQSGKLIPFLIKDWRVNLNYTQYILTPREEISFSHSKVDKTFPFSSDDIIFSMKLYLKKMKDHEIYPANIKNILKNKKGSVEITLKRPDPLFLNNLTGPLGIILSKKYYDYLLSKKELSKFYLLPLSTGPYEVTSLKSKKMKISKKKNYHFGAVSIDSFSFIYEKKMKKREQFLQSKICDIAFDVNEVDTKENHLLISPDSSLVFLEIPKNSSLKKIMNPLELFTLIDFSKVTQVLSKDKKLISNPLPIGSEYFKLIKHLNYFYSQKKGEEFRKKHSHQTIPINLFISKKILIRSKNLKKDLLNLKKEFKRVGFDLKLSTREESDLVFDEKDLYGFRDKILYTYFDVFPKDGDLTPEWFSRFTQPKDNFIFPLYYEDFKIGISNKLSGFHPTRGALSNLATIGQIKN